MYGDVPSRYDPRVHHRRSIRLSQCDYRAAGIYFVTLCTAGRECLFGDLVGDELQPTPLGHLVAECWTWLATQYPYVELDAWVLMPNHLHGILVMMPGAEGVHAADIGAVREPPLNDPPMKRKPLGQLIGAFKTVSTKRVNELRGTSGEVLWQRNYYEHIVRDAAEMDRIRRYIADNPRRWLLDSENPSCARPQGRITMRPYGYTPHARSANCATNSCEKYGSYSLRPCRW